LKYPKLRRRHRLPYAFLKYVYGHRNNMGFAPAGKDVSFNNRNVKFVIIHKDGLDRPLELSGQQSEGVCSVSGAKDAKSAVFGSAAYNAPDPGLVGGYDCKKDMV
jgi:hypothetical protein